MLFTVDEAAREACMRIHEILNAIDEEELETIEGPDGETLIPGVKLVEFIESRRAEEEDDEDEAEDE
jgi:hypothetical protein